MPSAAVVPRSAPDAGEQATTTTRVDASKMKAEEARMVGPKARGPLAKPNWTGPARLAAVAGAADVVGTEEGDVRASPVMPLRCTWLVGCSPPTGGSCAHARRIRGAASRSAQITRCMDSSGHVPQSLCVRLWRNLPGAGTWSTSRSRGLSRPRQDRRSYLRWPSESLLSRLFQST